MMLLPLIALVLIFIQWISADSTLPSTGSRRCFERDLMAFNDPIRNFSSSPCLACDKQRTVFHENELKLSIAVILSPWMDPHRNDTLNPALNLVAGLISDGHSVTLYDLFDGSCFPPGYESQNVSLDLAEQILEALPCEFQVGSKFPVNGRAINVQMGGGFCERDKRKMLDMNPFDALDHVEPILTGLRRMAENQERPDIVVIDAANVGGLLWAQKAQIPVVMYVTPAHKDLILERRNIYHGPIDFVKRRAQSLRIGFKFSRMNVIRRLMGLELYKMPSDYFVFTDAVIYEKQQTFPFPGHVYALAPTLPRCVPCDDALPNDDEVRIVITETELGLWETRTIIRALSMAKASIKDVEELCDLEDHFLDEEQEGDICETYRPQSGFKAVWLVEEESDERFPELLPSFISFEESNLIDALARYPETRLIITKCSKDASDVGSMLGLTVICVPRKHSTSVGASMGQRIIEILTEKGGETRFTFHVATAVDMVEGVGLLKQARPDITREQTKELIRQTREEKAAEQQCPADAEGDAVDEDDDQEEKAWGQLSWFIVCRLAWGFLFVAICNAMLFLEMVDEPSDIPTFRRKMGRISNLFEDSYPALMCLQQWASDESSLHNLLAKPVEQHEPKKRDSQSGRRRKALKKK